MQRIAHKTHGRRSGLTRTGVERDVSSCGQGRDRQPRGSHYSSSGSYPTNCGWEPLLRHIRATASVATTLLRPTGNPQCTSRPKEADEKPYLGTTGLYRRLRDDRKSTLGCESQTGLVWQTALDRPFGHAAASPPSWWHTRRHAQRGRPYPLHPIRVQPCNDSVQGCFAPVSPDARGVRGRRKHCRAESHSVSGPPSRGGRRNPG